MTTNILRSMALCLLAVGLSAPAFGQTASDMEAVEREIQSLKDGQERIIKQLQAITDLLNRRAPNRRAAAAEPVADVNLTIKDRPFKGDANARVTVIEFSDYQCPFCSRFAKGTLPRLVKDYVDTGKVKYVFRDYPIENIHKNAFKAAEAAHCAGEAGKYWEMHDQLFANRQSLGPEMLLEHAQAIGLDPEALRACLESERYAAGIRQDLADGEQAGVRGTPTFFLGLADPKDGRVKAQKRIRGARPYATFKQAIDELLASTTATN